MRLTNAEVQIMIILWELEEATVQDILNNFKGNKPARTTIATVLSVLEGKGFVNHSTNNRINIYKPTIKKYTYFKKQLSRFVLNYFNSSYSSLLSFFAKETDLTIEEIDTILKEAHKTSTKNKIK